MKTGTVATVDLTLYNCNEKKIIVSHQKRPSPGKKVHRLPQMHTFGLIDLTASAVPEIGSSKYSTGTYKRCAAQHWEHKQWNRELTLKCKF